MKLQDIISFAKAGYKPSDVKELLAMEGANENDRSDNNSDNSDTAKVTTDNSENSTDSDSNKDNMEDNKDVEKYKSEIEDLKNQIKLLQEANKNKDISGNNNNKTLDETIVEIFNKL